MKPQAETPPTAWLLHAQVMHQRNRPAWHRFIYPVFCVRLNLAGLQQVQGAIFGVNCHRPLSLWFKDYGPRDGSDLLLWIRRLLQKQGVIADGDIYLQTFPRVLGYAFNPVSFWYCHERDGQLRAVLAEVNNTFGEHHLYLIQSQEAGKLGSGQVCTARKMMHVSPFCEIKGEYRFRFRERQHSTVVNIDYHDQPGEALIATAIAGKKLAFSQSAALRALLRQPLLTLGVMARIHWQALLLWRKKIPFFKHVQQAQGSTFSNNHGTHNKESFK